MSYILCVTAMTLIKQLHITPWTRTTKYAVMLKMKTPFTVIEETANKGRKISESSFGSMEDPDKKRNGRISESSDYSDLDNEDCKQLMEAFPGKIDYT